MAFRRIASRRVHRYRTASMRFAVWSVILFQFFFVNVFLPVHTRGSITLNGASSCTNDAAAKETRSCCSSKKDSHIPTSEDRKCCAVCYVGSMYTPVDPITLELVLRESLELSHDQAVAQVRSLDFPTPFWPVGPPAVA